ncbi:unnamed protein product [Nesidiocoris tenuis]|uniref:Uncharacterized protein n=1 Tax=Nesidiocoris tenuis TaxID=355587 RepID=A0A6H5G3G6_9HEMI|nr:unnamed protein product [Nesidiocoris tenuis]
MELELFKPHTDFKEMVRQIDRIFSSTKGLAQHYLWAIEYVEGLRPQFLDLKRNNEKLLADLQQAQRRIDDLEKVNANARKMLEEEMVKRKRTREHAEQLEIQLKNVKKALCDEAVDLNKATWAGFSFLQSEDECEPDRLDTIDEIETTGSIMTDLSYTREEDELLNDSPPESRRQKRPLAGETDNQEFGVKRRKSTTFRSLEVKSTDRVVATTTVTVERNNGPCTATATIETHKTATTPAISRRTANITPLRNVGRPASDSDFEVTFRNHCGLHSAHITDGAISCHPLHQRDRSSRVEGPRPVQDPWLRQGSQIAEGAKRIEGVVQFERKKQNSANLSLMCTSGRRIRSIHSKLSGYTTLQKQNHFLNNFLLCVLLNFLSVYGVRRTDKEILLQICVLKPEKNVIEKIFRTFVKRFIPTNYIRTSDVVRLPLLTPDIANKLLFLKTLTILDSIMRLSFCFISKWKFRNRPKIENRNRDI